MSDAKSEKGTLIHGADGGVYYITDDQLQAFRLPDAATKEVGSALERPTAGQSLAAVHGDDLVDHVGGHQVALPGRHIELGQVGGHPVNMDAQAPPKRKGAQGLPEPGLLPKPMHQSCRARRLADPALPTLRARRASHVPL